MMPLRLLRAVSLGTVLVQAALGVALADITFSESQRRTLIAAARALTPADFSRATRDAQAGSVESQLMVAVVYSTGGAVPRDPVQAVQWLEKAAEQGHPMALDGLGVYYARGEGVAHDDAKAIALTTRAGEMGYGPAQNRLGVAYQLGDAVPRDPAAAVAWYRKAAEQGYTAAQHNLAKAYDNGLGVPVDHVEAAAWLRAAAKRNDANAQFDLAMAYHNGEGVTKSLNLCEYWLQKASDQGHAASTFYLGMLIGERERFAQDAADRYLWQSATQGYALAALALARRARDPQYKHREAYKWLLVAQGLEQREEWRKRWARERPWDAEELRRTLPELVTATRKKLTPWEITSCERSAEQFLATYGPRESWRYWPDT
jgi:TPR repeat protein